MNCASALRFFIPRGHRALFTLMIFFSAAAFKPAFGQRVETLVSVDSLRIGDPFEVVLLVGTSQAFPDFTLPERPYGEGIGFIDRKRFKISTYRDSVIYRLQYFSISDTVLPGIPVNFYGAGRDTSVRSARIPLFFTSVLPDSEATEAELRPMKPNYSFPMPLWLLLLIIAGVSAAAIGAWAGWRWWTNRVPEPEPEPLDLPDFEHPIDVLRTTLDGLDSQISRLEAADFDAFYVELGNAIRAYVERVYEIPALEMTSSELLRALDSYRARDPLIQSTRAVLAEADLVKFAKYTPTREMAGFAVSRAREFLRTAQVEDRYRIERMREDFLKEQAQRIQEHEMKTAGVEGVAGAGGEKGDSGKKGAVAAVANGVRVVSASVEGGEDATAKLEEAASKKSAAEAQVNDVKQVKEEKDV